nr:MAG TPA: hypothetical protein [Caudoviricetes sp.]
MFFSYLENFWCLNYNLLLRVYCGRKLISLL